MIPRPKLAQVFEGALRWAVPWMFPEVRFLRNDDTQRFLAALSKETGIPVSLDLDVEKTGNPAFSALIEHRGKGAHVWGHKTGAPAPAARGALGR